MRTILILGLILTLATSSAIAVVFPDPDLIGVYFDQDADNFQHWTGPSIPFFAYFILTNPSADEVHGFEFLTETEVPTGMESLFFQLAFTIHGFNDIHPVEPPNPNMVVINLAVPHPASETIILVTAQYMLLAPMEVLFRVGPTTGELGTSGIMGYWSESETIPLSPSLGDHFDFVATVNYEGHIMPVETSTFGSLKALYR